MIFNEARDLKRGITALSLVLSCLLKDKNFAD